MILCELKANNQVRRLEYIISQSTKQALAGERKTAQEMHALTRKMDALKSLYLRLDRTLQLSLAATTTTAKAPSTTVSNLLDTTLQTPIMVVVNDNIMAVRAIHMLTFNATSVINMVT
ncbi:hypothetical protein GOP47_0011598 [Adiantum capillus-veneris]|uniref:Uncharacterized protein n=1 Tax=Adiantum capillus-veneris TaxID=13818 RepID=A0A9D4ZHT9_ADICA|nr:hypothetical protein GOP47_0011598 [Adiantum capillus-veneris]